MDSANSTTPIRELMPDKFLRTIMNRCKAINGKAPQRGTLSDVIIQERHTSKYWPFVEELARQKDPAKYEDRMAYLLQLEREAA